jgi:O-antigen/teichoic acid export membrane protein
MSLKVQLFKIFSLNSIATLVRIFFNLILIKTIAYKLGTNGMAYFGQFSSLVSIVSISATGGITNGIVKYTAEFKNNKRSLLQYVNTANKISLFVACFNALILLFFCNYISKNLFGSYNYNWVIFSYGIIVIFYVISTVAIAIINGFGEYTRVIKINVYFTIFSSIISVIATLVWGISGALFSLSISQFIQFIVILSLINKRSINFFVNGLKLKINNVYSAYSSYAIMSLISAVCIPVSLLIIKQIIIKNISVNDAGIYEGMLKISNIYLGIISTTLTFYFLPRFSSSTENEINREIILSQKIIIPFSIIALFIIFLTKDITIKLFLSKKFYDIRNIMGWQLIGDFFRISSYLFAIYLIAKKKVLKHIFFEVLFAFLFIGMSLFFIYKKDLSFISISYAISTCIVFWLLILTHFIKKLIK